MSSSTENITIDRERNKFTYMNKEYPVTVNNLDAYKQQDPSKLSEIVLDI